MPDAYRYYDDQEQERRGFPWWILLFLFGLPGTFIVGWFTWGAVLTTNFANQMVRDGAPVPQVLQWFFGKDAVPGVTDLPQVDWAPGAGLNITVQPGDLVPAILAINGEKFGQKTTLGDGSVDGFISAALPYAEELHGLVGTLPVSVILAQWANETGYGTALYGWNFGNQKDFATDLSGHTYAAYASPDAGVRAEARLLLGNGRYGSLLGQATPNSAAQAWGLSGWAESHYDNGAGPGSMLVSIIQSYNLARFDTAINGTGIAIPPAPTGLPQNRTDALTWALDLARVGSTQYSARANGGVALCEQFVENAYGKSGILGSAKAGESGAGFHPGGLTGALPGAVVEFAPSADNGDLGHVGLYLGGDLMVSATDSKVTVTSITWWAAHSAPLVGWRDPFTPDPVKQSLSPTSTDPAVILKGGVAA